MPALMNIGFGNAVNKQRVIAVISSDSSPARRLMQSAREEGTLVDATQGRKTKSLVLTDSSYIISCALTCDTLMQRFNDEPDQTGSEKDE